MIINQMFLAVKSRSKSKEGAKDGWFAKFPKDIVLCEELTGGDPNLLEKEPFVEKNERVNYKELFGSPEEKKSPAKAAASPGGKGRKRLAAARDSGGGTAAAKAARKETPVRSNPRFQAKASAHQVIDTWTFSLGLVSQSFNLPALIF